MIPTNYYIFLGSGLFTIGVVGVLTRRNVLIILMSIELILNAVNINLVALSQYFHSRRRPGICDVRNYRCGRRSSGGPGPDHCPVPQQRDGQCGRDRPVEMVRRLKLV